VRSADAATMTRHWKLLVFPAHAGTFTLPPLVTRVFSPAGGRQELRCNAATLQVTAASDPARSRAAREGAPPTSPGPSTTLGMTVGALALIAIILIVPAVRRAFALRRRVREIARPPEEIRVKLQALLAAHRLDEAALLREQSDRGDAYRSLHSRLDFDHSQEEVEFRLRDFLQLLK
jgi:hypothetical protein